MIVLLQAWGNTNLLFSQIFISPWILKVLLIGHFQEALSSLMDYINISPWNNKSDICRKKQCSSSWKISHKEQNMMYNSNRIYKELLESKWSYSICKILLSQKRLIHSEDSHWKMFHNKFRLHNECFDLLWTKL